MRRNPFGSGQARQGGRRGFGFSPRLLILVAFIAYGAYYYFSNRSTDPLTGEPVLIDKSISPQDEKALGLQAYQATLAQERPVDPASQIPRQVRELAHRLSAKGPELEDDRTSVEWGERGSVRVDLGSARRTKQNTHTKKNKI